MEFVLRNPYLHFLQEVRKPARYIGGEHFSVKKEWNSVQARVALCFPEVYEIGMSYMGYKILYTALNEQEHILAERCFAPRGDMEEQIRKRRLPLVTLENSRPLGEFDIVGFTLQYEMTYTNLLNMLDLGEITLWQAERREEEPLVIAGGPCSCNPEPLAPFLDLVVLGDGEEIFVKIAEFVAQSRREGRKREEILNSLSQWTGIYVPSLYKTKMDRKSAFLVPEGPRVRKHLISDLNGRSWPVKAPIPHTTTVFDKFSIELARGCTEGCRFCQAGMIYRPVREREPQLIIDTVMKGLKSCGFDQASLSALSSADYSQITPLVVSLLDRLQKDNSNLGIASLRAYGLDNRVLDKMAELKNSSLTFAPEAGTQRMRDLARCQKKRCQVTFSGNNAPRM